MIIGLTGSIGSGKSTASARLAALGARVLDADEISRALTRPGGQALPAIRAAFGSDVFDESGALNRRALAALVFADADKRRALNAIIHPLALEQMRVGAADILETDPRALIVWDVPLLIEAGWDVFCDEVWLVRAALETRVARVIARDGCTREDALARVGAQMDDVKKARRADEVIENDGDKATLFARIDALYARAAECAL